MRHSIKLKFFAAFSAVAVLFIALLSALNLFFYDGFFNMERRHSLQDIYHSISETFDGTTESVSNLLISAEESQGARMTLVTSDGTILYDTTLRQLVSSNDPGSKQLRAGRDSLFSDLNLTAAALRDADSAALNSKGFDFVTVHSEQTRSDWICLVGRLGDDYFISRTPQAYLEASQRFNSTFLLATGLVTLLLSLLPAWWLSRRFTKPLIRMGEAANAMAGLDFSCKYVGQTEDEIGRLGQSLNLLSEHLEQAIGELQEKNSALSRENEEKERIDALRREFIVNVSHELKTPIAVIQGYAEGLREGIADDPADRSYYCDTICDEAKRMNKMVLQLLSLSSLELGRIEAEHEPFDLGELCSSIIRQTASLAAERQLHVGSTVADCMIVSDENLVSQIVMNYMTNALRYARTGGAIELSAERRPEEFILRVYNEGDTIPADALPRLWEQFYRTDKARSRESGGTGIGLSIVRAAADLIGGRVWAQNEPGGVAFYAAFPRQAELTAPPEPKT